MAAAQWVWPGRGPWKFLHEGVHDWRPGLKRGDPSSVYFAAVEERKRSVRRGEGGGEKGGLWTKGKEKLVGTCMDCVV